MTIKVDILTAQDFQNRRAVQNALLPQIPQNVYEDLDAKLIAGQRTPLVLIPDLRQKGLTVNYNSLGVMKSGYKTMSQFNRPSVSMAPAQSEANRLDFKTTYVPLPLIETSFTLNDREMDAAIRGGEKIDLTHAFEASKAIAEEVERIGFLGSSASLDGLTIPGLTTIANRETKTLSDWGNDGPIVDDVADMVQKLRARNFRGPYVLYLSEFFYSKIELPRSADNQVSYKKTLLDTFSGVLLDIKSSSFLNPTVATNGRAVLVQMDESSIDLAIGSEVDYDVMRVKPKVYEFTVFAAMVHRIKTNYSSQPAVCDGEFTA